MNIEQTYPDDECLDIKTKRGTTIGRMHLPSATVIAYFPPGFVDPEPQHATLTEHDGVVCYRWALEEGNAEATEESQAYLKALLVYAAATDQ